MPLQYGRIQLRLPCHSGNGLNFEEWLFLLMLQNTPRLSCWVKWAKVIKTSFPLVTTLVSYQDIAVHKGTIYKAANWVPDAIHKGGSWNRPNSKNLNGKPRTRPDRNNAIGEKQRWIYKIR